MAGALTVQTLVTLTGLGNTKIVDSTAITMTVPVTYQEGFTVITTATTTALALFAMVDHIALTDMYGVYLKCEVGTLYILVDTAGTATFAAADADLVLDVGESCWLPINPAGNLGLCLDGVGPTTAVSWLIVGNAP